jgi:prepilin-type N-terminal cleavage/methylation domain-containing protein
VKLNSSHFNSGLPKRRRAAFTLVEVLVSMAILVIIILGMMEVFTHTQTAFRANLTQTDVLESGRDVMDLIKSDLEEMTPSFGQTNNFANNFQGAVNFYANANLNYTPLIQSLVGVSSPTIQRTNVLESFFILSRQNVNGSDCWVGTGYAVVTNSSSGLYSLYRFTTSPPYPVMSRGPEYTFYNNLAFSNSTNNFLSFFAAPTNYSHLMDGVVALTVRAFDTNGVWMNLQNWQNGQVTNKNVEYLPLQSGEGGFYMFSNMLPASVEVEMGVLEDRTLQHAEGLSSAAVTNYLADHAGQVHIFRQRIPIRNVDPSAYQ